MPGRMHVLVLCLSLAVAEELSTPTLGLSNPDVEDNMFGAGAGQVLEAEAYEDWVNTDSRRQLKETAGSGSAGKVIMLGATKDEGGCLTAAGYSWCESKGKCLRVWEESCTGPAPTPDDYQAVPFHDFGSGSGAFDFGSGSGGWDGSGEYWGTGSGDYWGLPSDYKGFSQGRYYGDEA